MIHYAKEGYANAAECGAAEGSVDRRISRVTCADCRARRRARIKAEADAYNAIIIPPYNDKAARAADKRGGK